MKEFMDFCVLFCYASTLQLGSSGFTKVHTVREDLNGDVHCNICSCFQLNFLNDSFRSFFMDLAIRITLSLFLILNKLLAVKWAFEIRTKFS